jgi:hypothetical protein
MILWSEQRKLFTNGTYKQHKLPEEGQIYKI